MTRSHPGPRRSRLRQPAPVATLFAAALALAGCASTHGLAPVTAPRDADSLAAARSIGAVASSDAAFPTQDWWTAFGDPQLAALVTEALVGTPGLDAADARVRQAQAQAGLAVLIACIHTLLITQGVIAPMGETSKILLFSVGTNFILFFFNLLPAPPLDGGHVAEGLMPYKHRSRFDAYARFGPFVIMAVALIPQLAQIFTIPATFCTEHLYSVMMRIFG